MGWTVLCCKPQQCVCIQIRAATTSNNLDQCADVQISVSAAATSDQIYGQVQKCSREYCGAFSNCFYTVFHIELANFSFVIIGFRGVVKEICKFLYSLSKIDQNSRYLGKLSSKTYQDSFLGLHLPSYYQYLSYNYKTISFVHSFIHFVAFLNDPLQ